MSNRIRAGVEFLRAYIRAKTIPKKIREKLRKYQKRQFRQFSKKWLSQSPYYSKYVGFKLSDYPIINKKKHMENFNLINTAKLDKDKAFKIAIESEKSRDFAPKYNDYSVGLSSGTTGSRGMFVTSDIERAQWAGAILAKMLPSGLNKKKIAFFLRANNNLYETVRNPLLEFMFYDMIIPVPEHIERLNRQNPTIIIAPAQLLKKLAQNSNLKITPQKIISVAEVLDDNDRQLIESRFNQIIHQIYQCTEGFIASTCKNGNLHINEDIVIVEKEKLSDGRFVPIISDYRRSTQPIIRYRLDDILLSSNKKCSCGSSFMLIKKIEGRCDDILQLEDKSGEVKDIFPDFIRNRIIAEGIIHEYVVIQVTSNILEIELSPLNQKTINYVESTLNDLWKYINVKIPEYKFKEICERSITEKKRRVRNQING